MEMLSQSTSNYGNMNLPEDPLPATSIRSLNDVNIVDVLYQLQYYISHLQSEHESCQLNKISYVAQSNTHLATIAKLQDENTFLKRRISMLEAALTNKGVKDPQLLLKPETLLPSEPSKLKEEPCETLDHLKNCLYGYLKKMKEIEEMPFPIERLQTKPIPAESGTGYEVTSNEPTSNYWMNLHGTLPETSSELQEKFNTISSSSFQIGQIPTENVPAKEHSKGNGVFTAEDDNKNPDVPMTDHDKYWASSLDAHLEAENENDDSDDDLCGIDAAELDRPFEEGPQKYQDFHTNFKVPSGLSPPLGMMSPNIGETSVFKAKVLDDAYSGPSQSSNIPVKEGNGTSPFLKILKKDQSISKSALDDHTFSEPLAVEVDKEDSLPVSKETSSGLTLRNKQLIGHLLPIEKVITKNDMDGNPILAVTISADCLIKIWNMTVQSQLDYFLPSITLRKHMVPLKNVAFVPSQGTVKPSKSGTAATGKSEVDGMEFIALDVDGFCSHWKLPDISTISPYDPFDPTYLQRFCRIQELPPSHIKLVSDRQS